MHGNVFPGVNSSQVQNVGETQVYIQVSRGQNDCYLLAQNYLKYIQYHQIPGIYKH